MEFIQKIKEELEKITHEARLAEENIQAEIKRAKIMKVKRMQEFKEAGKDTAEVEMLYDEHIRVLEKALEFYK